MCQFSHPIIGYKYKDLSRLLQIENVPVFAHAINYAEVTKQMLVS